MGTDIHAYIEYKPEQRGFQSFTRGHLHLWRDYELFHALGAWGQRDGVSPLFAPRGLPDAITDEVQGAYFTPVFADEYFAAAYAARPRPRGAPFYLLQSEVENDPHHRHLEPRGNPASGQWSVPDPDWHTPSWLTYSEVLAALAHVGLSVADRQPDFRAAVAAMAVLAEAYGPERVRLVFWFDN